MELDAARKPIVVTFIERSKDRSVIARGRTGIVLGTGSKLFYMVALIDGRGFRLLRVPFNRLADLSPLYEYVAGQPDPTRPYDPQKAARAFLRSGKQFAGITPAAEQHLSNLVNGKGFKMNDSEQATTQDPAEQPKPKRKAPAKKATPKPAEKKAKGAQANGDARHTSDADKIIEVKVDSNPRRAGTQVFENFKLVKRYNGKTLGKYLKAGGRLDMIRDDIERQYVALR